MIPNAGHAVRDRDALQAGAEGESIIPDAGHAVRDRDARQAGAVVESIIPDAGHAIFHGNRCHVGPKSVPAGIIDRIILHRPRAADGQCAGDGVKGPGHAVAAGTGEITQGFKGMARGRGIGLRRGAAVPAEREAGGAAIEHIIIAVADDAVGVQDVGARQAAAVSESIIPNAGDAGRNRDARQAGAAVESIIPNAGHAVRDRDARQAGAAVESMIPNAGHAVRDRDTLQAGAAVENAAASAGHAGRDRNAGQAGAAVERVTADDGDAVRNGDAGQAGAALESIIPNAGHAVRNRDACQIGAAVESVLANAGHAAADAHGPDAGAIAVPGHRRSAAVIRHRSRAADGQHAGVFVQCPRDVRPAAAADVRHCRAAAQQRKQQRRHREHDPQFPFHVFLLLLTPQQEGAPFLFHPASLTTIPSLAACATSAVREWIPERSIMLSR